MALRIRVSLALVAMFSMNLAACGQGAVQSAPLLIAKPATLIFHSLGSNAVRTVDLESSVAIQDLKEEDDCESPAGPLLRFAPLSAKIATTASVNLTPLRAGHCNVYFTSSYSSNRAQVGVTITLGS